MHSATHALAWLAPGQEFPPVDTAWGSNSPANGLLAAGGELDVASLSRAYSHGIFPWFNEGQPVLWWSPDPRMVLPVKEFSIKPSFKKTLQKFRKTQGCEIRVDSAFEQVIQACASSPRTGQAGTWIVSEMVAAYVQLHRSGLAHSVEAWVDGKLVGGLYCVALGRAIFGESMFSRASDGSKIALAALIAFCRRHAIAHVDCQQNTRHLASLGAREISREQFLRLVAGAIGQTAPAWHFDPLYWREILATPSNTP
jgi:leucyl/phenylalanyl-tRNA--protein transferase